MYLTEKWKIRSQSTVVPLLLICFLSSTSQPATCEQYEHLGNEKSGQLFVESLNPISNGTQIFLPDLLLCIMVEYLLLLEPVVLEQDSSHATGWTT